MASKKLCIVVGCGMKGIGDACVRKYGKEGFQVAFLARSSGNLDVIENEHADPSWAKGFVCDVSDQQSVIATYTSILNHFNTDTVHTLIYNATMPLFKTFDQISDEEMEANLMTGPMGLFRFAKLVLPKMEQKGEGVIGITGATASWRGMPSSMGIASAKMAMRAMAQSLCRDYGRKGIHVFHAIIDGIVDQPRTHAWMPDKPHDEFLNPDSIANTYWNIAQQDRSCWTFEFNVGPSPVSADMLTI